MRISNPKIVSSAITLTPADADASMAGRRKELAALIQAALKVGSDLPSREAGRRAFAEFMKLVPGVQPANAIAVAASGQVLFTGAKRKKMRGAIL
ncbi:hypothetical protein ACELLULO517_07935 [Acidisoma cellulosilytica]|uniref:Uncharacterized protein n=1 Tax=Acidisoma cellulosilyticum TaxID=2802395 RepID=A0A963YZX7_9PROT|nr:hypothetical protein [Acidisoma cellulosilyticum]MCB8880159.1 hypothetical protein [Acidisoma cellulosilyticum]